VKKDIPATSQTLDEEAGPRPQNISLESREVMGLLSLTVLVHCVAWSVLAVHKSCHVECAETAATEARRIAAVFILAFFSKRWMHGMNGRADEARDVRIAELDVPRREDLRRTRQ
jgi:hypothetical protein